MLLDRQTKEKLDELDRLLRDDDRVQLESRVNEEIENGLLGDQMLSAARAMQLPPVVMFLATLGHYNLPAPNDRSAWLAIYQSLSSRRVTSELAQTPADNPMRQIVEAILTHDKDETQELKFRFAPHYEHHWIPALELALDWKQYAVALRVLQARTGSARGWPRDHWLKLAKAVLERLRRPGVRGEVMDTGALGDLYATILSHLPAQAEFNEPRDWLTVMAGEALLRDRQYDRAIEYLQRMQQSLFRVRAWINLASAHCFKGETREPVDLLDQALVALQEQRDFDDYIDDERYRDPDDLNVSKKYDTAGASAALHALQKILLVKGVQPFLVSGTLLGYAREGGILEHDHDIDIGIVGWEDQYSIVSAVLESGQFEVGVQDVNGSETYFISVRHRETGHYIDLFFYHEEDGKYVTGVHNTFGFTQKFAFSPFGLQKIRYLGMDFFAPDDIDRNLSENYGDWRVPDKAYISHLESPSTMNVGGPVYQIVARLTLLEAARTGNLTKFDRARKQLAAHAGNDHGAGAEVLHAADKIRGELQRHRAELRDA